MRLSNSSGIEQVLDELARQNAEQRELSDQLAESWRNDAARSREEILAAFREIAGATVRTIKVGNENKGQGRERNEGNGR